MTSTAADVWIDIVLLHPNLAVLGGTDLLTIFISRLEAKIGNQSGVTKMRGRVAMAIEAPLHGKRFDLRHNFHLVDPTMTRDATDTCGDVSTVIKINKVR